MIFRLFALIALLLLGGALFYFAQSKWGSKPPGLTAIASRLPKDTGFLLAMDMRQSVDLKRDVQVLREKLKDNPEAVKAIEKAEADLGIKLEEFCTWALPAGFLAVVPAKGNARLWTVSAQATNAGQLTACKSNLKNLATACEMWSTDNSGRYPMELSQLPPNYMKTIPTCPATAEARYSYERAEAPDNFTMRCTGKHGDKPSPSYNAMQGLVADDGNTAPARPLPEPGAIFGAPVADEKLCQTHIDKLLARSGEKPKQENISGTNFYVLDKTFLGIHKGYLLCASSRYALDSLLASFEGTGESLASQPIYVEMRKKISAEQGVLVYAPLEGIAEVLDSLPKQYWDQLTKENLQTLRYVAGGANLNGSNLHTDLVLGVTPNEKADFAKALLQAPAARLRSAELVPAEWNYYSAVDAHYLLNVVLEACRLSPELRGKLDMGLSVMAMQGLDLEKNIFTAFTGEVAWTGDLMTKLPSVFNANFERARGQGQLTACKSNLKNIATACEMWASDNAGRYPKELSQLTPSYLKTIPTCPTAGKDSYSATYKAQANPDFFAVACGGHNHGTPDDFPQYNANEGLIEGDTKAPAAPSLDQMPTTLIYLGVKNQEECDKLLKKLDAQFPLSSAGKVGNVELLKYPNTPEPLLRASISQPTPALWLAYGPDSEALLKKVLEVKGPVSQTPEFRKVQGDSPERWVSQSFLDMRSIMDTLTKVIDSAPASDETKIAKTLLDSLKEARGVTYTVVDPDCVRIVSDGNAAVATGGVAVAAAILVPNFIRARAQGQLTACKSNEKNIATALEMYSTDNAGRYPTSTAALVEGKYLRHIPTCPGAGRDTYSETYKVASMPDVYTFHCSGENHKGANTPADYPQYNAVMGLVDRP